MMQMHLELVNRVVSQEVPVSDKLNAVVSRRIEVAPGLLIMRVVPEGWDLPEFTAGQYTVLGLPGSAPRHVVSDEEDTPRDPTRLIKRAYSISSSLLPRYPRSSWSSISPCSPPAP
jgi:hypothetical protein